MANKASELRAKDVAALETEIKDLLKSHFNLRMQRATQQLQDNSALKKEYDRLFLLPPTPTRG